MGMNKQLKLGLSIGCGFLVVVVLLVVGGGTYWATNTGKEFKAAIQVEKKLNKEYGVLGVYQPAGWGVPPENRVATFVQIRQSMAEYQLGMQMALEQYINQKNEHSGSGFMETINAVRAGSRLGPAYAQFWQARNEKLLEYGMGAGEYAYIYGLAYYGFLGHDPGEGVDGLGGLSTSEPMVGVRVVVADSDQELSQAEKARRRAASMILDFFEKVEFQTDGNPDPGLVVWQAEMQTEIVNFNANPFHILFQTQKSETLENIFGKFRKDLEDAYASRVDPLELFFQQEVEEETDGE